MSNLYDWLAPVWGTVALQPFAYLWCIISDVDYISSLGPFTVLSTIYLMPPAMHYVEKRILGDKNERSKRI